MLYTIFTAPFLTWQMFICHLFFYHSPASILTQKIIRNWCRKPVVMQIYYAKNSVFIRVCKAKKVMPWQMKSTRILMFSPPKKLYFAVICRVLPLSKMYKVLLRCHMTLNFSTYLGISRQNKANRYTHS